MRGGHLRGGSGRCRRPRHRPRQPLPCSAEACHYHLVVNTTKKLDYARGEVDGDSRDQTREEGGGGYARGMGDTGGGGRGVRTAGFPLLTGGLGGRRFHGHGGRGVPCGRGRRCVWKVEGGRGRGAATGDQNSRRGGWGGVRSRQLLSPLVDFRKTAPFGLYEKWVL